MKLSPSFKAAFLQSVDFVSITCLAALIGTIQLNCTSILLSSFFLSFFFDNCSAGAKMSEPATWVALDRLHNDQKKVKKKKKVATGNNSHHPPPHVVHTLLVLPPLKRKTLAPPRRLHKICKGRTVSARSESAKASLDVAVAWLAAERKKGRSTFLGKGGARGRRGLVKELKKVLGVSNDTARGLVTKLKQKKLLPEG